MSIQNKYYRIVVMVCLLLWSSPTFSQQLDFTPHCQKAYQLFISFKLKEARAELSKEFTEHPKNIMPYMLINYEDFITLTFNENPELYKAKKAVFHGRLKLLDKADHNSPYFLFLKGLLYFQWSMVEAKHTSFTDAALDFRKSHLCFKENQKAFPKFSQNQIYAGMQEAMISAVPKGYKWIAALLGLNGNLTKGMSKLKQYINSNETAFREEALVFYIYLKNYLENDSKGAYDLISTYQMDTKNNLMYCFMAANLALNNRNAQLAEKVLVNRNTSAEYFYFPMMDYELADAKLKRLDLSAITYFQKFIAEYKGYYYIKDAYYQMALIYHLQGKPDQASAMLRNAVTQGYDEADADKQALKNAKKNYLPNKELLKARLHNDGGYYAEALKILESIKPSSLKTEGEKLEYTYRYARVNDDIGNPDKAITYYLQTITNGSSSTEHFAARSALQIAFIYEKRNQKDLAITYYNKVLSMDNHDYKNSLDQRAKSGIARLKKE
jgi:Tetratricopeptide repeat